MTVTNDLSTAGQYFLTITTELVVLFIAISFVVGLIREYVPEETIRRLLSSRHRVTGATLGAFFGALTPFCSCSTIPLLVGLINSGVPFSTSMAFLVASPLLNPIIVTLSLTFFGPFVTLVYCVITFGIAVASSLVLERWGFSRYIKPVELGHRAPSPSAESGCCQGSTVPGVTATTGCCSGDRGTQAPSTECRCSPAVPAGPACCSGAVGNGSSGSLHTARMQSALGFSFSLFRQVLPYLILGAAIGAFIYGFVPEDRIVFLAGPQNPLAIPVAAVIGIPMYIRAETIIPIGAVLLEKGMGMGAVMALIIGGAGASIPEVTLLASIFKRRLVAAFVTVVFAVAIGTGVVLQLLQAAGIIG